MQRADHLLHDRLPNPKSSRIPLVDIVAHARAVHVPIRRGSDVITTAAIYGAAALATVGFLIASVVDEVLHVERANP
jgi:hypothetical protein